MNVAREAYERLEVSGVDLREPGEADALPVVAFSAFAVEALLNEIAAFALSDAFHDPETPSIATFASLLQEAERSRASTLLKFRLFFVALNGSAPDARLASDLRLLFAVRDLLAHTHLDTRPGGKGLAFEDPKLVGRLRALDVLALESARPLGIVDRVATRAMAAWALRVAERVAADVTHAIPQGELRTQVLDLFGACFGVARGPRECGR